MFLLESELIDLWTSYSLYLLKRMSILFELKMKAKKVVFSELSAQDGSIFGNGQRKYIFSVALRDAFFGSVCFELPEFWMRQAYLQSARTITDLTKSSAFLAVIYNFCVSRSLVSTSLGLSMA